MLNLNFVRWASGPGCFVTQGATPEDTIIVIVHVDDLLSVGQRKNLDNFLVQLARTWKLQRVEYFEIARSVLSLGDHITRYKDRISLKSRKAYEDNMPAMLSMEGCKPTDTPMVRKEPRANIDEELLKRSESDVSVRGGHLDVFQETSF